MTQQRRTNRQRAQEMCDKRDGTGAEDDDDFTGKIERDITTDRILPPAQFRSENFARMNIDAVGEYADYRALAWAPERAFLRVFGTDYADIYLSARIEALEHNLVYRKLFASKFGQLNLDDLWDAKMAAYELLLLVNNPFTRDSVRHGAIKDLNLLYGIVIVDPNGNQTPGKDWTAFYRDANGSERVGSVRHPDPGSPEAEKYVEDLRKTPDA